MLKKPAALFKTIQGRITVMTAATTLLITVITVSVCFYVFQSFVLKNQVQSSEFSLQVVANNIQSDMNDIIGFTTWCYTNGTIKDYLEKVSDPDLSGSDSSVVAKPLRPVTLKAYDRLKEEYDSTRSSDYISRALISSSNYNKYIQIRNLASGTTSDSARVIQSSAFFQALYEAPEMKWTGFVNDPFYHVDVDQQLPIVRPITSDYSSDVLGWVFVSISSDLFTHYLNSYPLEKDSLIYLTIGDKTYLYDKYNGLKERLPDYQIIKSLENTGLNSNTVVQKVKLAGGQQRIIVSRPVEEFDGWYVTQILTAGQQSRQAVLYQILIVFICIIIVSLGGLLILFLNRTISRPVKQIRQKIDLISQGDFSPDPSIEWEHELGKIGKGINRLSQDVVTLMDKKIADEKQKKDLEYQILQSQINPHFLYNTLNSIKWMATIQNATGIAEMTTALARLLKSVSKGSAALITLEQELDLIKDYFLIQQYRYGGSISIEYQIESEDLYDCMVHRFSLQPIVENALFHGIEPKGTTGKITVKAESVILNEKKCLRISITDNGIGMTKETIDRVLHGENETKADFFKQVGINNVNQRIRHDFGDAYGISIQSEPGVYTTMIILLPYMTASL